MFYFYLESIEMSVNVCSRKKIIWKNKKVKGWESLENKKRLREKFQTKKEDKEENQNEKERNIVEKNVVC